MVSSLIALISNYLNNCFDQVSFVQSCEKIYKAAVKNPQLNYELDSLIALPFAHELAYFPYTDAELKQRAEYMQNVLSGKQPYYYSSFYKLLVHQDDKKVLLDVYNGAVNFMELYHVISEPITQPTTLRDVIYNSLFDILSNISQPDFESSSFNYVYCAEEASCDQIRKRAFTLLSYLLGVEPFLLQAHYLQNGQVCYVIT